MENEVLERYFSGNYSLKESSIPLSFREQALVSLAEGELFEKSYLFICERKELPFSEICSLRQRFLSSLPIVFLLKGNSRKRGALLVKENIPFVAEDGFVFLPQVLIYGHWPTPLSQEVSLWHDSYIPAIHYFLLNPLEKTNSLEFQAKLSSYSRSLLIKALAYLTGLGFLRREGAVRSTRYALAHSLKDSYALVRSHLVNPLRASYYVESSDASSLSHEILSSESALAHYSNIVPEEEAYLLNRKDFLSHRDLFVGPNERSFSKAYVRFDLFAYTPLLLRSGSSFVLNPLDVIAIYRDDPDPRVKDAIEHMEEIYQ